jgi:hypothetical protein
MNDAVIAGGFAFLTAVIAALWNSRLARRAEVEKELRTAVAEVAKYTAASAHAMSWLTFNALYNPKRLTAEEITEYHETINHLFNELVEFRVIVAALDKRIHNGITPVVNRLCKLDEDIAKATILFRDAPEEGIKVLASYNQPVKKFEGELLEQITVLLISK